MTHLLSGMETVRDLGWTLIHFLWQGLLLAALLNVILPLCRGAVARHNWALATLGMMAMAPVMTFLSIHDFGGGGGAALHATGLAMAAASLPWTGWLVLFWLGGITILSLRALGGWYAARQLERLDTLAVPAGLLQRCHGLQRRLRVTGPVRFLLSRRINVPLVIGWLQPVVLIPVSVMAGLSPQQLDALILHELAHIRRLDTVINVMLVAVETILFYHPAIWWVSRKVRIEREHCCDDLAVTACGDAGLYVEALTSLSPWKAAGAAVLAANGGKLKNRVARLLEPCDSRRFSLSAMAGLAFLSLVAASVATAQTATNPITNTPLPYPAESPKGTSLQPIAGTHTLPPYPKQSAHLHEQGKTMLAVTIGTDGRVAKARIDRSSGHQQLDARAAEYVKSHWRWEPPTRNGKPVVATTMVGVVFQLRARR